MSAARPQPGDYDKPKERRKFMRSKIIAAVVAVARAAWRPAAEQTVEVVHCGLRAVRQQR
jgi:hypothetical protein